MKKFVYDGVFEGKKVISWECVLSERIVNENGKEKKVLLPDTNEPESWWKQNYTKENGAFWYKVGEIK